MSTDMGMLDSWSELGSGLKDIGRQLYEDWRAPSGGMIPGPSSSQERCGGQLTGDEMRYGRKDSREANSR